MMLLFLALQAAAPPLRFAAFSGVFLVVALSCLLVATVLVIRDFRRGLRADPTAPRRCGSATVG